jgi:hypothetical protein
MSEPLIRVLAELPHVDPDPARAERIRMGCRARLARQAACDSILRDWGARTKAVPVWQPLLAVLGIAYLAEVILQALRVYGPP